MRTKFSIILIATGLLIGFLLISQVRSGVPKQSTFPLDQLQAKEALIKDYLDEQNELKSRITTLRQEITKKEETLTSYSGATDTLNELRKENGLIPAEGEGIEIYLADNPNIDRESTAPTSEALIYAADLRDIVNLLQLSDVEGIAINNQRILYNSPLTSVGNSILVNNSHLLPPFTIKVIGDPANLFARLTNPLLLPDLHRRVAQGGIVFKVTPKDLVELPVYNGTFQLKFISD